MKNDKFIRENHEKDSYNIYIQDEFTAIGDKELSVEFHYPSCEGNVNSVKIGMCAVRVSDEIRVEFCRERNGWLISKELVYMYDEEDSSMLFSHTGKWLEVAFLPFHQTEVEVDKKTFDFLEKEYDYEG